MAYRSPALRVTDIPRVAPHISAIRQAALNGGADVEDPFKLAAIGLRETEFGWSKGYAPPGDPDGWGDDPDGPGGTLGYGYGFFQIDRRYHRPFLFTPGHDTVLGQAQYACKVLAQARKFLRPLLHDSRLVEFATYSAYNAGPRRVLWAIVSKPGAALAETMRLADSVTTGGDYAAWVYAKAEELRKANPKLF